MADTSQTIDSELLMTKISDASELPICCHGTYYKGWDFIRYMKSNIAIRKPGRKLLPVHRETGLSRMTRNHIHFVQSFDSDSGSGAISGLRSNAQVHVYVDVPLALQHGIEFFRSSNGVILSPGDSANPNSNLHPAFFEKVIDAASGSPVTGWQRPELPEWAAPSSVAQAPQPAAAAGAPVEAAAVQC